MELPTQKLVHTFGALADLGQEITDSRDVSEMLLTSLHLLLGALAIPALSPLVIKPHGRFSISPSHFTERHGALVIIVFGESVVDIGIGAEGHPVTVSLVLSAVLGLNFRKPSTSLRKPDRHC